MAEMNENLDPQDLERDLMTLTDDEGVEHEFEVIDTLDLDDERYMALIPVFDAPEDSLDDSGELVILKVVVDEAAKEEYLEPIEDDAEFTKVADMFMERLEDYFDFEE